MTAASNEVGPARKRIDLRSDLLVEPTEEMRARFTAALADTSYFGLREDPLQREVEREIATLTGKEDALLFPTCTMANQTAIALLTRAGDTVLAQQEAHILTSEAGAPAAISGVQVRTVAGDAAAPEPARWKEELERAAGVQQSRVAAISVENTHNRSGGRVLDAAYLSAVIAEVDAFGVRKHLDGARLANAAVARDVPMHALTSGFDTVAISLNKGLAAPMGAALAGSRRSIEHALAVRQRLGGGMRRYGPIAAATKVALRDYSHIRDDHGRAKMLARGLARVPGCAVDPDRIESNIVIVQLDAGAGAAARVGDALAARDILVLLLDDNRIRMTTYRGIADEHIGEVVHAFDEVLKDRHRDNRR